MCALKIGGWAPIDLLLHDAEEAARDRAESRAAGLRRRDARARRARRSRDRRRALRWRLARSADAGGVSTRERCAASRSAPPACPDFKSKDTVLNRPEGDPRDAAHRRAGRTSSSPILHPALLRHVVGSARAAPRRPLDVRPAARRSDRQGRRHVCRGRSPGRRTSSGARRAAAIIRQASAAVGPRADRDRVGRGAATLGIEAEIAAGEPIEIAADCRALKTVRAARDSARSCTPSSRPLPLDASDELVHRVAATQARIINASAEEIHAAAGVVSAVLRHDLMTRARASASVKRETPVSWLQKDGTLIEGVLDLAFDEGERHHRRRLQDRSRAGRGRDPLPDPAAPVRDRRLPRHRTRGVAASSSACSNREGPPTADCELPLRRRL